MRDFLEYLIYCVKRAKYYGNLGGNLVGEHEREKQGELGGGLREREGGEEGRSGGGRGGGGGEGGGEGEGKIMVTILDKVSGSIHFLKIILSLKKVSF